MKKKHFNSRHILCKAILLLFLLSSETHAQNCSVNAGVGYTVCPGNIFILDGNASGTFQGSTIHWSIVSQPGAISIVNPTQLYTTTTVATVPGNYVFQLQVTCGDASIVTQNVTYTIGAGAGTPGQITNTAISNPLCAALNGTSTITFTGNSALPANTTQQWTYSSNAFYGSFDNAAIDNPVFTIGTIDKYKCPSTGYIAVTRTFTNTISGCRSSVTKTFNVITADITVDAYAGLCNGIGLTGTCPGAGTSAWSVVSTTPTTPVTFSNPAGTSTSVTNPVAGTTYTLRYTVAGSGCTDGFKDVTFTYNPLPAGSGTSPNAGVDQTYATALPAMVTLSGNEPGTGETGMWSQISGPTAIIDSLNDAVTTVRGLINGSVYIFRWTITKVNGCSSYDDVTVKGPVLLSPTNGSSICISNAPQDPPALTAVTLGNFPFGAVDSIYVKFTMLSGPANIGSTSTPIRYFLNGGNSCVNGCLQGTGAVSTASPIYTFTGIPATSLSAAPANQSASNYNYSIKFYPKLLGSYVFRYEYSVNNGAVQTGTVTIKVSRNFAANAGTGLDLSCNATSTSLAGSNMVFNNTNDPSNSLTFAPDYSGEWSTVLKPAGATDPFNAGNKYLRNPTITGLVDGKYTFRLAAKGNLEAGNCGSDSYVDVYAHSVAPTPQTLPAISVCNSGSVQLTMPETGYFPKGWAQVSGPSTATFSPSVNSRVVTAGNLVAGSYQFSFTDSSKCGNAVSTVSVTIGTSTITQPTVTCSWVTTPSRVLTLNATKPDYANGETGEFVRLVKGMEISPFSNGGNGALYNTRTITPIGSNATDTIVNITGWQSSSFGEAIVVVYKISKPGCTTTTDTFLFNKDIGPADQLNRTVEVCNQTFPFTYTPVPTSTIATVGNSPGNFEWFQELNTQWSIVSAPAGATPPVVGTPGSINSTITFATPGDYIIKASYPESDELTVCSGTGVFNPNYSMFVVKIGGPTAPALAGNDQVVCAPGAVNLSASPAAGTWSVLSFNNAPAPHIVNPTAATSAVNFSSGGDAQLQWTPVAVYPWCAVSNFDVVRISYITKPVIAGPAVTNLCSVPVSYAVNYNAPGSSLVTASFTQVSGPTTTTITAQGSESSTITNLAGGTYVFKYSFTSTACGTRDTTIKLVLGTCLSINGHLWLDNDGNATNNSEVNTNLNGAMWAYLTDGSGAIIGKTMIDATGYYAFNDVVSGGTYSVVIGQANTANIGGSINTAAIPSGYVNTGVNLGGVANAANQTGIINFGVVTTNQPNSDFGIERLPESAVSTQAAGPDPGGTISTTLTPSWFQASNVGANPNTLDYDGGTVTSIRITSFPSNTTSITIGTTKYYPVVDSIPVGCAGTCLPWPPAGVTVPYANGTGPIPAIQLDPVNGPVSIVIPFAAIDNAGKEDPTPGSLTLSFNAPLKVKLISFTAAADGDNVILQWEVDEEIDVKQYDVQFGTDGVGFGNIGIVRATGNRFYNMRHTDPVNGINYYRLKSLDMDGRFTYSPVRTVNFSKGKASVSIYPNPAKNSLNILLPYSMLHHLVTIRVIGMDGKVVLSRQISSAKPTEVLNTSKLASGRYQLHIISNEEDISRSIEVVK